METDDQEKEVGHRQLSVPVVRLNAKEYSEFIFISQIDNRLDLFLKYPTIL